MLSNCVTAEKKRVGSDKEISLERRNELVALAEAKLSEGFELYHWAADIHGINIELRTNSEHLSDFWIDNWYPAPGGPCVLPHGRIYAVMGIEGEEPRGYYHHDTKTAIFINTEYYGQCKSWALGIAADILETQHDVHSIHGSCAVVGGKGVVIIAPTGTGKSTHTWGLMQLPEGLVHSDDWIFVRYGDNGARAYISERKYYLRTDMVDSFPELVPLLDRSKCENVENDDFTAFGNSRAILDPEWIGGPGKFVTEADVHSVILLRRDKESPPEVKLNSEEAITVLEEGRYQVLSGAGDNVGEFSYESFYNPYLLVKRPGLQKAFFRRLFSTATCHILNTGVENVQETQARIRRIITD
ncbi:MAG: hypothetical protein ACE5DW_03565 [Thermodesulfobacteriota bacterium]